jgi:hypothetical protein
MALSDEGSSLEVEDLIINRNASESPEGVVPPGGGGGATQEEGDGGDSIFGSESTQFHREDAPTPQSVSVEAPLLPAEEKTEMPTVEELSVVIAVIEKKPPTEDERVPADEKVPADERVPPADEKLPADAKAVLAAKLRNEKFEGNGYVLDSVYPSSLQ